MRTILSRVILERVSEGWRKKQGEGGRGASVTGETIDFSWKGKMIHETGLRDT